MPGIYVPLPSLWKYVAVTVRCHIVSGNRNGGPATLPDILLIIQFFSLSHWMWYSVDYLWASGKASVWAVCWLSAHRVLLPCRRRGQRFRQRKRLHGGMCDGAAAGQHQGPCGGWRRECRAGGRKHQRRQRPRPLPSPGRWPRPHGSGPAEAVEIMAVGLLPRSAGICCYAPQQPGQQPWRSS